MPNLFSTAHLSRPFSFLNFALAEEGPNSGLWPQLFSAKIISEKSCETPTPTSGSTTEPDSKIGVKVEHVFTVEINHNWV